MTAQKGKDVVLKIGDGVTPVEGFTTIGGMRLTRLTAGRDALAASDAASGPWRRLHVAGGVRRVSLRGEGVFSDSVAEDALRIQALGGDSANYELHFGNGDRLSGAFVVTEYERFGDVRDAEAFRVALESSGAVSYSHDL